MFSVLICVLATSLVIAPCVKVASLEYFVFCHMYVNHGFELTQKLSMEFGV